MIKKIFLLCYLFIFVTPLYSKASGFECSSSSKDCPFDSPDSTFGIIGLATATLPHLFLQGSPDRFKLSPVFNVGNNGYVAAEFSARTYFSNKKDWLAFSKLDVRRLGNAKLSNITAALGGGYSFYPNSQITITTDLVVLSEKYSGIDQIRTSPAFLINIENRLNDYQGLIGGAEFVAHEHTWWNLYAGMKLYFKNTTGISAISLRVGFQKDHFLNEEYTYIGIGL